MEEGRGDVLEGGGLAIVGSVTRVEFSVKERRRFRVYRSDFLFNLKSLFI